MPQSKRKKEPAEKSFLSEMDFGIEIFKEKIPDNGEDSYIYHFDNRGGIVGVFDGCGGSGAKRYEKYKCKTGAYMASRAVGCAAKDWFLELVDIDKSDDKVEELQRRITDYLHLCKDISGAVSVIKGSMSKEFPTTAAVIVAADKGDGVQAACLWAGDSRCYLLDCDGLKQLSKDDIGDIDAMENLSADGVLTNVISASKSFTIHHRTIQINKPCILFTATDGCFGYFSTPMEFEYLLLETLMASASPNEWESRIKAILTDVSGDDFTLCGYCLGFGGFDEMKKKFYQRAKSIFHNYINGLEKKNSEEKKQLWDNYKIGYACYIKK